MRLDSDLNPPKYDPNLLLDALQRKHNLKTDAELARFLEVHAAMISKLRHRRLQISAGLIVNIHDVTGMSLRDLRALMGDDRPCCLITKNKPTH